jgi:hypothetical protein
VPQNRADAAETDEDGGGGDGRDDAMTQDERWKKRYNEVKSFIETNHRNPSRHRIEEHDMLNWMKHQRKLMNAGELKPERIEKFKKLTELANKYKRVNQYQ